MEQDEHRIKNDWSKNLVKLKTIYDNLNKKTKKPLTNKQFIVKINNEHIKADHVLFREFLQNYSNPKQLSAPSSFSQIQSFFNLLNQNYQQIQRKYLKHSIQDKQQIENQKNKQQIKIEIDGFFQRNKLTLSKFIKDENQFFQSSLRNNIENGENFGIPGNKAGDLLKDLFSNNPYIRFYINSQQYFNEVSLTEKINKLVKIYAQITKQISLNEVQLGQFFISEEQILDFLTFWLQSETQQSDLFIIYARTQPMVRQLENQYKKYKIQKEKLKSNQDQIQIQLLESPTFKKYQPQIQIKINQNKSIKPLEQVKDLKINLNKDISGEQNRINFILDKYRQSQIQQSLDQSSIRPKTISKEERLQKILPSLFTQACKNRTKMLKGTTFDQIQDQLKTMNLQKFINFCTNFGIHQIISRQILIENFKNHAINRLTLDLKRFGILLNKFVEKYPQLLDILLKNQRELKIQVSRNKLRRIVTDRQNSLSKYNYKLRPVNGKDIGSIQEDLREKKQLKQLMKKQKMSLIMNKKQAYLHKLKNPNQKKLIGKQSGMSDSKMSLLNSNQTSQYLPRSQPRNYSERFNPQSLISNIEGEDQYWDQYEAKIWKKDNSRNNTFITNQADRKPTLNESTLQSALSKRIQKGKKVLQKMNSSNLKYYL